MSNKWQSLTRIDEQSLGEINGGMFSRIKEILANPTPMGVSTPHRTIPAPTAAQVAQANQVFV